MWKRRNRTAVVGVILMVALALWMRQLTAWRPKLVATSYWAPTGEFYVSRDGRFLWSGEKGGAGSAIFLDATSSDPAPLPPESLDFSTYKGIEEWPRLVRREHYTEFQAQRGAKIVQVAASSACAFSLSRHEIYTTSFQQASPGHIVSIWNMSNGHLKRRVRFIAGDHDAELAFSPDGQWLIASQELGNYSPYRMRSQFPTRLRRYDVQSGAALSTPDITDLRSGIAQPRFSPDGRFLLLGPGLNSPRALVFETSTWKRVWRADGIEHANWMPDNRLGLLKNGRLEWRDAATGRLVQTLSLPLPGTRVWTTSPDECWVYTGDDKGIVRRWRAR